MSLQALTFILSLRFTGSSLLSSRPHPGPQLTKQPPRPHLRLRVSRYLRPQTSVSKVIMIMIMIVIVIVIVIMIVEH